MFSEEKNVLDDLFYTDFMNTFSLREDNSTKKINFFKLLNEAYKDQIT